MSEPLTAEELAAIWARSQNYSDSRDVRALMGEIDRLNKLTESLAVIVRAHVTDDEWEQIRGVVLPSLARHVDKDEAEIKRLQAELAAAQENAVSDRVKLDAALVGQKAALERCVGYTRELATAREDTARLDDVIARAQIDRGVYFVPPMSGHGWRYRDHDEDGHVGCVGEGDSPRAAIDAARKESR